MTLPTVIIADQVRFDSHWSLLAGVTYTKIIDDTWTYANFLSGKGATTANPEYNNSAVSPTASLSFAPISNVTTYFSYTQGLQQGAVVGSTFANAGAVLSPYTSNEYEAGVKSTVNGVNLNLVGFNINTANLYSDPTTNIQSENGREDHKGLEFSSAGRIGNRVTLTGGFTVLNAKVTDTPTAILKDKWPVAVPGQIIRFYAEYAVPGLKRFSVNGGASYTSKTWYDSANTIKVPSVATGDAGARYEWHAGDRLSGTLRINVTNLANNNYWTNTGGALNLGAPRLFLCSSEIRF
jgi:iron complex outermembrane receptor protein